MLPETSNPAEELLKRYAEKRRQQAGGAFELHPADRQRLQQAVQEHYAAGPRPSRQGMGAWFLAWWPQMRMAVGILAVMGVVAWVVFHDQPTGSPQIMAKQGIVPAKAREVVKVAESSNPEPLLAPTLTQPAPVVAVAPPAPSAPAPVPAPLPAAPAPVLAESVSKPDVAKFAPAARAMRAAPPPPAKEASGPGIADDFARNDRMVAARKSEAAVMGAGARSGEEKQGALAGAAPTMARDDSVAAPALTRGYAGAGGGGAGLKMAPRARVVQYNMNTALPSAPVAQQRYRLVQAESGATTLPILDTFTVEQGADQLRILDADGSVYEMQSNRIAALAAPAATAERAVPELRAQTTLSADAVAGLRFSGTNSRLGQPVVLTLSFAATNQSASLTNPPLAAPAKFRAKLGAPIEGTLRVGDGPERRMRAMPVTP